MSKPVLQLAAVGLAGFAVWKLAGMFLIPLVFLIVKIAFIACLVALAIWYFGKHRDDKKEEGPAAEG